MPRVVLDPNVLVSALISPLGTPAAILSRWIEGWFDLVVSPALLAELERALAYTKIGRYATREDCARYVEHLRSNATLAEDPAAVPPAVTDDPGDDYLIALVRTAEVDALVTGDAHLLGLTDPPVRVVRPQQFLSLLDRL